MPRPNKLKNHVRKATLTTYIKDMNTIVLGRLRLKMHGKGINKVFQDYQSYYNLVNNIRIKIQA